jgi:KDO2-lipid IV(A) lauroyltransferase
MSKRNRKTTKLLLHNILSVPLAAVVVVISLLPFGLLMLLSKLLYFLVWHVTGYRKKVVLQNLKIAFPEKEEKERKRLARAFYRHFSELIMETVGLLTVSAKSMRGRIMLDPESHKIMARYYNEGKMAVMLTAHYGNWEWMGPGFNLAHSGQIIAAYRPQSAKIFDYLIFKTRMRFYELLIPFNQVARKIVSISRSGQPAVFALLADQRPKPDTAYWMPFFGVETSFYSGPEKLARKLGLPVLFCAIRKQKPGRYLINVRIITEDPKSLPEKQITAQYAALLEQEIRRAPQYWLWSHRRWKGLPSETGDGRKETGN